MDDGENAAIVPADVEGLNDELEAAVEGAELDAGTDDEDEDDDDADAAAATGVAFVLVAVG